MNKLILSVFWLCSIFWSADAFLAGGRMLVRQDNLRSPTRPSTTTSTSTTNIPPSLVPLLQAAKKQTPPTTNKQKRETVQITDPLELLVLYLTPWKNPNSIFVYLFALLYILGTISEARSAAGH